MLRWIGEGKLKLRIEKTYALADAAQAHRDLEGRKTAGKLLLIPEVNRRRPCQRTRREKRRAAAAASNEPKLDALLVTNLHNVRYLTGFTGSNGAVLLSRGGRAVLFTDPRYTVQSQQPGRLHGTDRQRTADAGRAARNRPRSRSAASASSATTMTVAQFETLEKGSAGPNQTRTRRRADRTSAHGQRCGRNRRIRASVVSNSRALEAALRLFKPGMTESELAAEIDYRNRKLGAEAPSFDTIVAAGERAALPHAQPGAAKIGPGMLLIDMGAFRDGYASDMTRMAHVGPATPKYKRAYRAVLEAQLAASGCREAGRNGRFHRPGRAAHAQKIRAGA